MLVHIHIYFSSELRSLTHRGGKKRGGGGSDGDVGLLHSDNYGYLGHFGCKSKLLLCSQNNLEKKQKQKGLGKREKLGSLLCAYTSEPHYLFYWVILKHLGLVS